MSTCDAIYAMELSHLNKPLLEASRMLGDVTMNCIECGNIEYGVYTAICCSFLSGTAEQNILESLKQSDAYLGILKKLNYTLGLNSIRFIRQGYINFVEGGASPWEINGEFIKEKIIYDEGTRANSSLYIFCFYLIKMFLAYAFENYEKAHEYMKGAEKNYGVAKIFYFGAHFCFYQTLTILARNHNGSLKINEKIQVIKNLMQMKNWSRHAPMNYLHKYYLMKAEYNRVKGKGRLATVFYNKAIKAARESRLLSEEALSYELAGRYYLSDENDIAAKSFINMATYCYERWGADAKVRQLKEKYRTILVNDVTPVSKLTRISLHETHHETHHESIHTTSSHGISKSLDLLSIIKASQAISGEIDLKKLVREMMRIVAENAGAEYALLFSVRSENLSVEAILSKGEINVTGGTAISNADFPQKIIDYCAHSKEYILTDNGAAHEKFSKDEYVKKNQTKSILCLPIIKQNNLKGIIYLENNLVEGAFTRERYEVLNMLTAQIAISLENAMLYKDLEEYNKNLEKKVDEKTSDIKSMLSNIKQGIFTVHSDHEEAVEIIGSDFSSHLVEILESNDLAGKNLSERVINNTNITSDQASLIRSIILSSIGENERTFEFNSSNLPSEFEKYFEGGVTKIIEIDWSPVIDKRSDLVQKILVTLRDVSTLRVLQAKAREQQEELMDISELIAVSADNFSRFVKSSNDLLAENIKLVQSSNGRDEKILSELFINMHTLKGNARTYHFMRLTAIIHEAEQYYVILRSDKNEPWNKDRLM
ncbi:MAG: GAF domain-containing protein, partial [Oligoflexales bacterium]|nr:GAF domain-containing protein [Oligoflexales bacterium]